MTIRRDLERLEAEGLLSRTHGGAILKRHMAEEPQYLDNVATHAEEKERIARAAAGMIQPGETVFLSSGTTAARVLRHVSPELEARVVTHNVGALAEAQGLKLEVILLGGRFRPRSNVVDGPAAVEFVSRFHAGRMLIGVDGFDLHEGLTTPSLGIAGVERAMIGHTRGEVVVLADLSKIGVVADVVICGLDQVDVVLVDDGGRRWRARGHATAGAALHRGLRPRAGSSVPSGSRRVEPEGAEARLDPTRANELFEVAERLAADARKLRDELEIEFISGQLAEVVAADYDLGEVVGVEQIFGGYVNLSFAVRTRDAERRAPVLRAQVQQGHRRARDPLRARARQPHQREGLPPRRAGLSRPRAARRSSRGRRRPTASA